MTTTLRDNIASDLKIAMKGRDKLRLETLRTLRAQLMEREIAKRGKGDLTSEEEISVVQTAVKKRRESIEMFQKAGRIDLVDIESKEIEIIQEYLPEQLSADEVEITVRRIMGEAGLSTAADFNKLMPAAMKELKGRADGRLIQELVRKLLGS